MPHTPGPWRRGTETRCDPYYVEVVSDSVVAGVATVHGKDRETQEANAALIIAAPELLAACKELTRALKNIGREVLVMDRPKEVIRLVRDGEAIGVAAEAAIAKATSHNGSEPVN